MTRDAGRRAVWGLLGVFVVGAAAALAARAATPVATQVSGSASMPFVDGRSFFIAFRRSSGTWGNPANITVNAKIRQQINMMQVDTPWVQVSVTRFDNNKTLGVVLTAKRGAGSAPPLYGSLMTTITDNGTPVPCGSINVTELTDFDPCPPPASK